MEDLNKWQESLNNIKTIKLDLTLALEMIKDINNLQELINKQNKYRWHDLFKDSKDLPKSKQKVLVYRQIRENEYEYAIDYNCNDHDGVDCRYEVWESDLIGYTVLKWKYIEEATEE